MLSRFRSMLDANTVLNTERVENSIQRQYSPACLIQSFLPCLFSNFAASLTAFCWRILLNSTYVEKHNSVGR